MICPFCGTTNLPGAETCIRCQNDIGPWDLPIAQDRVEEAIMHQTVRSLSPTSPLTLPITATLGDALKLMTGKGIGAALIVDEQHRLCGILTERDFLRKVAGIIDDFHHLPVREYMTPNPITVTMNEPLAFALREMDTGGYRHLPVVENGVPIGTISVRDILRHITRLTKKGM